MPTWTLAQYQQQCALDPSTAGAIVALQPGVYSASWNFILAGTYTNVGWQTLVLDCHPTNTAYVNNAANITWMSKLISGTGTRLSFSLSTALGIVSGILAFHPAQTATYTIAPPSSPAPGTTYQSGYSTTNNPSQAGNAAAVGVAALTPLSSTNIGYGLGPDAQTADAVRKIVPLLVDSLRKSCDPPISEGTDFLPDRYQIKTQCRWIMPE